jgi:hypothetical protein
MRYLKMKSLKESFFWKGGCLRNIKIALHGMEYVNIIDIAAPHVVVALKEDKHQYMPVLVNFELLCALYFLNMLLSFWSSI